jgi:hypothetical protein
MQKAFILFLRLPVAPSLDGTGRRGAILTSRKVEGESSTLSFTGIRFDMLPLVKDRLGLSRNSKIIIGPISIICPASFVTVGKVSVHVVQVYCQLPKF